ncbi:MAG: Cna B-type domain-containing protein, partial [Firmicutes bacterium]|nr:Cna B-type domain-containing protein [Bacillota bacterium]
MRRFKKLFSIMMCCVMMVNYMPSIAFAEDAGTTGGGAAVTDLGAPEVSKTLTPNGDGTYNLSLSVTGKSQASTESSKADVIIIMDVSRSMSYETGDTTRLAAAKKSTKKLASELLSNNDSTTPDKVQLSLVSFSNHASVKIAQTTSLNDFNSKLDDLKANGGTNWEDALQVAKTIQTREGAAKYVIFVSDGNPTFRNTGNGWDDYSKSYGAYGTGQESSQNIYRCYEMAKDDAKAFTDAGYKFYGIGAYGNVDRMKNLVTYANGNEDNYFSCKDSEEIEAAFTNIVNEITNKFSYESVVVSDGVTSLTSMVNVDGTVGDFKYTKGGQPWAGAPAASFNNGTVTWDLSSIRKLEDTKYEVSFTVWPSQRAYDIAAAVANGTISYGDTTTKVGDKAVTAAEWNQLTQQGGLKTNTEAKVDYVQLKEETGKDPVRTPGTVVITNPDPIPLASTKLLVTKSWVDDLTSGSDRPSEITVVITQDGKDYKEVVLNAANEWKQEITVAPGIVVAPNAHGAGSNGILVPGHVYTAYEKNYKNSNGEVVTGVENHYELKVAPVQPMMNGNTTNDTEDLIDLKSNTVWTGNKAELTAINTVKGGINITKEVAGDTANRSEFTFTVTLKDKDGKAVSTPADSKSGDLGYRIYEGSNEVDKGDIENGQVTLTIKQNQTIRIVNVPAGTAYEVSEADAAGFRLQSATGTTGTVQGNDSPTAAFVNEKVKGEDKVDPVTITINKIDANTNNAIPATDANKAVFTVYTDAECTNAIGTTTLKDGKLVYKFTSEGTFYIKETAAPVGYTLNPEVKTVVVTQVQTGESVIDGKWVKTYKLESDLTNDSYTVADTPELTSVTVKKVWNDDNDRDRKRADYGVTLYADNVAVGSEVILDKATLTKTWNNLPAYKDGVKIVYTVEETTVPAEYVKVVTGDATHGFTITNTHKIAETSVDVTKVWSDDNNRDNKRPSSVTVQLKANGTAVEGKTLTLNDGNNWAGSFTKLPKYEAGVAITYTIAEISVPEGYKSVVTGDASKGFTVTNTYKPAETSVAVEKVWNDDNNRDNLRPASVTVQLKANGVAVEGKTLTLNDGNNWTGEFKNLPVNEAGQAIRYTITEVSAPAGYTVAITGDAANGYTVTNTHKPAETSVDVTKVWNDDNNRDNLRPESVTVQLKANGVAVDGKTVTLNADNKWKGEFKNLPVNEAGQAVKYTIAEVSVPEG